VVVDERIEETKKLDNGTNRYTIVRAALGPLPSSWPRWWKGTPANSMGLPDDLPREVNQFSQSLLHDVPPITIPAPRAVVLTIGAV
jgi:hypothetical protein